MRRIAQYFQLPIKEKYQYLECGLLFFYAWIKTRYISHKMLIASFGVAWHETPLDMQDPAVQRIKLMMRRISYYLPLPSACLAQAMVAQYFLSKYSLGATLYVGSYFCKKSNKFFEHAWLRCGSVIVTGARGHQGYTVISIFGNANGCKSVALT